MADLPEDLQGAITLGKQVHDTVLNDLMNSGVPYFAADPVATLIGAIPLIGGTLFASILALMRSVFVPTAVAILQILSQLRQDAAPQLAEVAGAVMGEFLGFEVTPDKFSAEEGIKGNIQRAGVLGSALHDLLTAEFAPTGNVTPATGAAAARTFSGYNINFAAQNAIISLFFDMASIHQAEQIRELGVEVATNLGLGRLHRSAMKPLIDNLIVKPYSKYMNDKYQQQSLTEQQLCQGYLSGLIDRPTLTQELKYLGYPITLHDVVVSFYTPQLTVQEVEALIKSGSTTEADGIALLRHNGWSADFATTKLQAVRAERLLRLEERIAHTMEGLVRDRYMDTETFSQQLSELHLSDNEATLYRQNVAVYLEHQYKHFTLAEITYMIDHNIITQQDVDDWAASIGFNEQDRLTLSLYFASKELDYEASVQAKKDAAAKKKAAALPKPPTTPPVAGG